MSEIHCETTGKGKNALILIHGFCGNHQIWSPFKSNMNKEWQVITPDLPGFGRSTMPGFPITIRSVAAQLNDWVLSRGFFRPVLIGHSLGGYVGLSMISQQPALFSGISLFHSTALADSDEKKAGRNKVLDFVKAHGVQRFVDSFIPGLYYNKTHQSIVKTYQIAVGTSEKAFFAYTVAMRDRASSIDMLANSVLPVLFLAGENDPILNCENLQKQAKLCPRGTFQSLPHTAHMGMFEARGMAATAINNFLEKIGGRD